LYVTFPLTPLFKRNVAGEIVDGVMDWLKVAVIASFNTTSVALFDGLVDVTVGATMGDVFLPLSAPPPHAVNNKASRNTVL
jgi:hypothetical protein